MRAPRPLNPCAGHLAPQAERRDLKGCLGSAPAWIRAALAAGRRVVVLATGDPLFHGIAGYLCGRLPDLPLEILPNLSTLQVACARLGLPWQDLRVVSGHRRGFIPPCWPSSPLGHPLARAPVLV